MARKKQTKNKKRAHEVGKPPAEPRPAKKQKKKKKQKSALNAQLVNNWATQLETTNAQLLSENHKLLGERDQAVAKNSQLETTNAELLSKNDKLEGEREQATSKVTRLEKEVSTFARQLEATRSELARVRTENQGLVLAQHAVAVVPVAAPLATQHAAAVVPDAVPSATQHAAAIVPDTAPSSGGVVPYLDAVASSDTNDYFDANQSLESTPSDDSGNEDSKPPPKRHVRSDWV